MTNCQKIDTNYGNLSISNRKGYFYAVRTVNNRKRQIYLGKCIPDSYTLNEVAKDIFSNDKEYWTKHTKQIRASDKDTNNSTLKDDLNRIMAIAKARGEELIAQELKKVVQNLT